MIRPATIDEQIQMSKLAAQAFTDDELFADVIHPHRQQYPNDTYLYWLPRLRQGWADPSNHYLVSTIERGNGQGEEIAAWAQFTSKSAKAKKETPAAPPVDVSDLPPNRAASKEYEDILERSYDSIAHEWAGPRAECWDIIWLATSPAHQGQGHGKALVEWVIEKATEDQVPSSVISAKGKDRFYNKMGYTIATSKAWEPESHPMYGLVEGGQFWWRESHLTTKPTKSQ
ncbi:hypothetical protein LTR33_016382 [Friedmanniomyces endolithicus]|nr:hypothetical protein LTR33_016382 [Friedmanniomyces endolithicus]